MMKARVLAYVMTAALLGPERGWPAPAIDTAASSEPIAFGYELFRGEIRDIGEGPVDRDYLVGPNDELLVETWGEYVKQYPVQVSPDGYIDLPAEDLRIFINGLTLRQVEAKITREMARIHATIFNWQDPTQSKAWVFVTPMRLGNILVYVAGEVVRPGTFNVRPTIASLINVITLAGGIKPSGSLRRLRVSRADGTTEEYDLYDFLIRGDTKAVKSRMKYGETVFVDLKRKSVTVRGVVRRSGIYEALETESLGDLLEYAGGPAPGAYLKRVQVTRRALNRGVQKLDVDFASLQDQGTTFPLLDGDVIEIFPSVEEEYVVYLEGGGVFRTGVFQFTEGMRLTDLIEKGEGLRGDSFLDKCDLVRTRPDYTLEYRSFSIDDLYKVDPETGRVDLVGDQSAPANFALRRLDRITVYSSYEISGKEKYVTLEGHVKEPGKYMLARNMRLSDLLFARGGFEDPDFRRTTYLDLAHLWRTMPDDQRTTLMTASLRRILEHDPREDVELQSNDRVVVFSYDEIVDKDKFVVLEGHVKRPGSYLLSINMKISDLLAAYGGFEDTDWKKRTYLDRADLWRTNPDDIGEKVIPIDLRKVLAGDPKDDLRLQSLDRLVVYQYKDFFPDSWYAIRGAVRMPGRFRLAQNTTLNDAIVMAHGLLDEAYKFEAEIVRILPADVAVAEPAKVFRVPISEDYATAGREDDFALVKDDEIFIRTVPGWEPPRVVAVDGEVRFPGDFILSKAAERLSDLLERAGGLRETAYLPAAALTRRSGENPAGGKRVRIAIDLQRALSHPGGEADVILRDGDALRVPPNPMIIEVRGAVQVPATLQHRKGRPVRYYIELCGGFREDALRRQTLVVNPDGTTDRGGWGWFQPRPLAGSVIAVPAEAESIEDLLEGAAGEAPEPGWKSPYPDDRTVGRGMPSVGKPRPTDLAATPVLTHADLAVTTGTVTDRRVPEPPRVPMPASTRSPGGREVEFPIP